MTAVVTVASDPAAALPPAQAAALRKAAGDFEAMALGELLKPMFETVDPAHGAFGGGEAEATWRPMLVQEIAKQVARGGGLGLAQPVLAALVRAQAGHDGAQDTPQPGETP